MIRLRPGEERGSGNHGWLETRYSFSFGNYYDPDHMGFRVLRVLNEDWIAPGAGFPTHPHRDMEIITYVIEGALEHKDTLGHSGVIRKGEIQWMRAGSGIEHSEFNPSPTEKTHLYQIWILPGQKGLAPAYAQFSIPQENGEGNFKLLASGDGREGSLAINQDMALLAGKFDPETEHEFRLEKNRHAWIQVVEGDITLEGRRLTAGGGAAVSELEKARFIAHEKSELLLFDLP